MGDPGRRRPNGRAAAAAGPRERARDAWKRRAWDDVWRQFRSADEAAPLSSEELEMMAMAAYLTGRDADYMSALDRAHHAHLDAGDYRRAARCAFWLGLRLALRGEKGPASGWLGRSRRLVERHGQACAEEGYLLIPAAEQQLGCGDGEAALATAGRAAEIGDRFGESDLGACARHLQGRALIRLGRVEPGLALLDEAMVSAVAGDLSPIMTGLIYCSVIDACHEICALDRAREWTAALARWCAGQPQLIAFTGPCLVHRAEIMQVSGAWGDAFEEARRACMAIPDGGGQDPPAAALYQLAELYRLRGEFDRAEEAYRQASRQGCEPQPGLALLRLAQGRVAVAAAAMRRAAGSTADRLQRIRLLPALVEVMLAAGDIDEARRAWRELEACAATYAMPVLRAQSAEAGGAVRLAGGDARGALDPLRRAVTLWREIGAPYLAARTRERIGLACRALGDDESAALELDAAREAFANLGAAPDLARIDAAAPVPAAAADAGLTPRELQVLRLVASGMTNKAIAAGLCLSERTVERHLSNIFDKLGVSSRTAVAAWAYAHGLAEASRDTTE